MSPFRLPLLAAALLVACGAPSTPTPGDGLAGKSALSNSATLPGSVPPWATAANLVGPASTTDYVNFRVYLGWQNAADLQTFVQAVSDPRSSSYRQYLTPGQFRTKYAPSNAAVTAVQQWLQSQGFNVVYTPANNHYVAAEGTVAQAAAAFGTTFNLYTVRGMALRAPASALVIPSSLGGTVSGVVGLDQTPQLVRTNLAHEPDATPAPAFVSAPPCSAYWGEKLATGFPNPFGSSPLPYVPCGYTPDQIKGAYGISGYDGTGQTVAIIDAFASPTIQQDVDTYSSLHGLPPANLTQIVAPGTYRHPEAGIVQDPQGWYGEQTLDVEAVHGMAPKAHIVFVGAANSFQDLDAALNHVVDSQLANIVTNSYGFSSEDVAPGYVIPYEDIFLQAVAQGIGLYFSAGDDSDESQAIGYVAADWPATSPYVTAVGGTSLAVSASNGYLFETAWGTARAHWTGSAWDTLRWVYGGGGGVSKLFGVPSYQQGVVSASVFAQYGRTGRAIPDVAAIGDPSTGMLVGQTQTFPDGTVKYAEYRIGGTSLSSPIFAGIMALADQARGAPHGFANPALYQLYGTSAFRDITNPPSTVAAVRADYYDFATASSGPLRYTLREFNQDTSLQAGTGYDDVTGLGSPTGALIQALSQ